MTSYSHKHDKPEDEHAQFKRKRLENDETDLENVKKVALVRQKTENEDLPKNLSRDEEEFDFGNPRAIIVTILLMPCLVFTINAACNKVKKHCF